MHNLYYWKTSVCVDNDIIQVHNLLFGCLCLGYTQAIPFRKQDNNHSAIHSTTKTSHLQIEVELRYLRTIFVLFRTFFYLKRLLTLTV